jgi:16S rRNA (uracil1498-N3)-methyltransferase
MKRIRLYQNTVFKVGDKISLEKNNEHHLLKVLRFPVGNTITLFNGDGFDYQAIVISTKKTYIVEVLSQQKNESESSLDLTLAQGIAKGEKMDFLIQKAVELGVSRIIPMQTEHCVVRLKAEKVAKRINHWQKIANHACGQSGRSVIVDISLPQTLTELLNKPNHNGFVLYHRATENLQNMEKPSKATILIGPEGGLSDAEIKQATNAGFQPLLLGKRILRTETASLVAIANMQLLWGS